MPQSNSRLEQVIAYMKAHWPSPVKPEWQVELKDYSAILVKVIADFTKDATKKHHLIRIAGVSGSGKTTQILPAVEAFTAKNNLQPILIAARRFVEYHPHYNEIKAYYGKENVRKMTDEFSTIMLFLTLSELTKSGYDIVLDVTLLDPKIEAILLDLLKAGNYTMLILMVAVSPLVTEKFLSARTWRHTKETEREFVKSTSYALEFYANKAPDSRIILWSVYDKAPIYDGPVKDSLETFADYSTRTKLPKSDDDARRNAKIDYLVNNL